jgi:hypothetical protein
MEDNTKNKPTIQGLEKLLDSPNQPIEILPNGEMRVAEDSLDFRSELLALLDQYIKEVDSKTPNFVLRDFLCDCLRSFDRAFNERR